MRVSLLLLAALAAGVAPACGGGDAAPRSIRLEGIRPEHSEGLFLNEELVLTFSQAIDPASITGSSLRIEAEDGTLARGLWSAQGRTLRFVPKPVLRSSLDDGGYLPGMSYRLIGVGFPRLDGLRGIDGEPLAWGFQWSFSTVEAGSDRPGIVFDDASPGRSEPLRPDVRQAHRRGGVRLTPWEPLVLTCMEPLDPSTLSADDFELIAYETPQRRVADRYQRVPEALPDRLHLSAVLRLNLPQGSRLPAPCCEIELHPPEPLRPGDYALVPRRALGLTDFHGNPVQVVFSKLSVHVEDALADAATRRPSLPFLDSSERSPIAVPGTDGLALWEGGRVAVRYPAAAGDGSGGVVDHGHEFPGPDVHATEVRVPAGETLALSPGTGLRVLRAQRGLVIEGRLTRRLGPDVVPRGPAEAKQPFLPGENLSEWLERAAAEGWDWTVVIAGGDLTVAGAIDVDTPLLLVAGGWIRAAGSVRHAPRQLWLMGDGGGVGDLTASTPSLILDPPRTNRLVEGLRVAVVSSSLPSAVRAYEWLGVDAAGHDGGGRWVVGFLPPTGPVDPEAAVGHPRLLPEEGPLRVLIRLEVHPAEAPGAPWDPPFVDYVDLRWRESE